MCAPGDSGVLRRWPGCRRNRLAGFRVPQGGFFEKLKIPLVNKRGYPYNTSSRHGGCGLVG